MKSWTCPICKKIYEGWSKLHYCEDCNYLENSKDVMEEIDRSWSDYSKDIIDTIKKSKVSDKKNKN